MSIDDLRVLVIEYAKSTSLLGGIPSLSTAQEKSILEGLALDFRPPIFTAPPRALQSWETFGDKHVAMYSQFQSAGFEWRKHWARGNEAW